MSSDNDRPFADQFATGKISRRTILSAGLAPFFLSPFALSLPGAQALSSLETVGPEEDGYRAWLRYEKIADPDLLDQYRRIISSVVVPGQSDTAAVIRKELLQALSALLASPVADKSDPAHDTLPAVVSGAVIIATAKSPFLAKLVLFDDVSKLGAEGFLIRSIQVGNDKATLIAAPTDQGALFGAFAFLRLLQMHRPLAHISISETPKNPLRIVGHSDNLDGTIERGYGGRSLWKWNELPEHVDERLSDYARLNASLGMNGVGLNNANSDPLILNQLNLKRAAALADRFRPYGLKVYLSPNFAAPQVLGHLTTADPLNDQVIQWWHDKAAEIYGLIPDFGGFKVKANSEDQPGPQDYGRTHAQGANMLAAALAPHGGIVMWRAFVYTVGNQDHDRVKRAYLEFHPLDGKFADNVLVQVKNGPLDFQPREPFHPLFGAMPKTRLMAELEITQEYLGQSTHLVYLANSWKEILDSNTYANGAHSCVGEVIASCPQPGSGGFSGDANVGSDRNWCGHHFAQANWYAFGRQAWNPDLTPAEIAEEWINMTWSQSPDVVECIREMMLESYEAYVNYTMPLGLHHMVGGDHYAPLPEGEGDPRGIFHHAALDGIGYDRTRAGSDAVDQYHSPLNDIFNDPARCPQKFLLWFHHLPWDHPMPSGRILWDELCFKYKTGINSANDMQKRWASLKGRIDARRHKEVAQKLKQQAIDSVNWSHKCLNYFAQYSKRVPNLDVS